MKLQISVKTGVKKLADRLQFNELAMRLHRSGMLVLCYHGVVAERRRDPWGYENCVDRQSLREQIRWLNSLMEPTNLAGLRKWRDGGWASKKGPLLITFDDGYRNNLTEAAPILKQEGTPALFFLTTGYVNTDRMLWTDEVRLRVLEWPEPEVRLPAGNLAAIPSELSARQSVADQARQDAKKLEANCCAKYLDYLRSGTPSFASMKDPEAHAFMSWDEARQLHSMGFEIGAHTVDHPILSRAKEPVDTELCESKATIERELNCTCISMAYPNGTEKDINEAVVDSGHRAGYDWSFMTTSRWSKADDDPFRIPRICVPGHADLDAFKLYASGVRSFLGA